MRRRSFASPIGRLTAAAEEDALRELWFDHDQPTAPGTDDTPLLRETEKQLTEYFAGRRAIFDLPLAPQGTEFQRAVWHELLAIPYGATTSYGEIARRVGGMKKVRAVGGAIGRNPIGIIIPCHRVIGSNGKLVGFGGGLSTKAFLLNLESGVDELFSEAPARPLSPLIG